MDARSPTPSEQDCPGFQFPAYAKRKAGEKRLGAIVSHQVDWEGPDPKVCELCGEDMKDGRGELSDASKRFCRGKR